MYYVDIYINKKLVYEIFFKNSIINEIPFPRATLYSKFILNEILKYELGLPPLKHKITFFDYYSYYSYYYSRGRTIGYRQLQFVQLYRFKKLKLTKLKIKLKC